MTKYRSCFSSPYFRNFFVTIFMLFAATASSFFFFHSVDSIQNISILYILSTVLTARFTVGYLPGILVSLAGVMSSRSNIDFGCVNWIGCNFQKTDYLACKESYEQSQQTE